MESDADDVEPDGNNENLDLEADAPTVEMMGALPLGVGVAGGSDSREDLPWAQDTLEADGLEPEDLEADSATSELKYEDLPPLPTPQAVRSSQKLLTRRGLGSIACVAFGLAPSWSH